jgi:hypothetical protein
MKARRAEVQTIRNPSACALLVDSLDRYTAGLPTNANTLISSSSWTTQKQNYILNGYFTRIALTQVQFFWNLPTIISGYNDQFTLTIENSLYTVTIPQGWYNANRLAQTLVNLINAIPESGGAFDFTLTAPPGCIVLHSGIFQFSIVDPLLLGPVPSPYARFLGTSGFIPQNSYSTDDGNWYIAYFGVPSLLPTRYIDITSHYLTKFQRVKDSSTLDTGDSQNILCRVFPFAGLADTTWPPVTTTISQTAPYDITYKWGVPSSFVVVQDYSSPKQIAWNPDEAISNFDILLQDEYGTVLPWSSSYGCEFDITLLCSET